MFDISFAELLVISVVALVVIGPERLPRVARALGFLVGRARRYVETVKNDIRNEIELDELRRIKDTVQNTAQSIEQSVKQEIQQIQATAHSISADTQDQNSKTTSLPNTNYPQRETTSVGSQSLPTPKSTNPVSND